MEGVDHTNEANGGEHHDLSVNDVSVLAASIRVVAAASVPAATCTWFRDGQQKHAVVPWFVDFDDACTAAFALVEVLFMVNFVVTHF